MEVTGWWLVPLTAVAAVVDFRTRRIPNVLIVIFLFAASALHVLSALQTDVSFIGSALVGLGLALMVALPSYALQVMGGGDVKLLAVVGWSLAWPAAAVMLLSWALFFAVWCLVAKVFGATRRQPMAPSILVGHVMALSVGLT